MLVLEELEHAPGTRSALLGRDRRLRRQQRRQPLDRARGSGSVRGYPACAHSAGLRPEDIDYVNAHGTSTRLNDETGDEGAARGVWRSCRQPRGQRQTSPCSATPWAPPAPWSWCLHCSPCVTASFRRLSIIVIPTRRVNWTTCLITRVADPCDWPIKEFLRLRRRKRRAGCQEIRGVPQ